MPELAEVETIKRQLVKKIVGKKIKAIDARVAKMVRPSVARMKEKLIGKKIEKLERRAKLLVWKLSGGLNLIFHLKMSGQVILAAKDEKPADRYR